MKFITGHHVVETAGARVAIDEKGIRIEAAVSGSTMFGCRPVSEGGQEQKPGPMVKYCPLRSRLYGIKEETEQTIVDSVLVNIEEYGMFTGERKIIDDKRTVSFGASEIIADAMISGFVDCAVMVCDGAGTVLIKDPSVVLAVGAHMTGLVSTSPIASTIEGLESRGCIILDEKATINQFEGFSLAIKEGFRSIAVTIVGREYHLAYQIKNFAKEKSVENYVIACHTTGICGFSAEVMGKFSDIVYACASSQVRQTIAPNAKIQIGSSIPVFGMSDGGKRMILNTASRMAEQLVISKGDIPNLNADQPRPLL